MPIPLLVDPLVRSQIRDYLRVGEHHVYVLGRLGLRVNVYSQQVRAINVAHVLAEELSPSDSSVAVVGGGVAGLTAAAAAAWLGFRSVTLYEKKRELMGAFRHNKVRYLHPHMYDWPDPGWDRDHADVPILDWRADTPQNVALSIEADWKLLRKVFPNIEQPPYTEAEVVRIVRRTGDEGARLVLCCRSGEPREFDAVVLALGFGKERDLRRGDSAYWSNDPFEETDDDHQCPRYFISGCGDGGLIDYLRVRLEGFNQANLIAELLPDGDPEVEDVKKELRRIERELVQKELDRIETEPGRPVPAPTDLETQKWLLRSYWDIEAKGVKKRIEERMRDTKALLTSHNPSPIEPGAFIVNRFLALQVLRFDHLALDGVGLPVNDPEAPFRPNQPLPVGDHGYYRVIPRHGPESELDSCFPEIASEFTRRSAGLSRVQDKTGQPGWKHGDRQYESSRRWALTRALLGIDTGPDPEYLLALLETFLRYCSEQTEAAQSVPALIGSNIDFIASRSTLATVFADLGDSPSERERQRLLFALRDHWVEFGFAYATARLAVGAFEDALAERLLLRFGQLLRQAPRDVAPGEVVPVPARILPYPSEDDEVEGPVPRLARFAWLPKNKDYEVCYEWQDRLPEIVSPCEVGILVPNPVYLPVQVGGNAIGWTAQLTRPEEQLSAVLALIDRAALGRSPIKALVMPELSTSPQIVAKLSERLSGWRGAGGLILAAGSYHRVQEIGGAAEHESALLIAGSHTAPPHLIRKSSRCSFQGTAAEGIQRRRPRITVLMGRSSAVVCLICADFKLPRVGEVLSMLRPGLVLVPACTGQRLRDRAFELARSSGAIVAIAQSRGSETPSASRSAAMVIGPPQDGESAPHQWSRKYPRSKPQLLRPPRRRSGRGEPGPS